MRIVITNDDGIEAEGIHVLALVARGLGGSVLVVAPDQDCSGRSQSLTLGRPVAVRTYPGPASVERYVVAGTPADCVRLVASGYFGPRPQLLLSGVNHGPNLGEDVWASGTDRGRPDGGVSGNPGHCDLVTQPRLVLGCTPSAALSAPGGGLGVCFSGNALQPQPPAFGAHLLRWTHLSHAWFLEYSLTTAKLDSETLVDLVRHPLEDLEHLSSDAATVLDGMASLTPLPVFASPSITGCWQESPFRPGQPIMPLHSDATPKPSAVPVSQPS